MGHTNSTLFTSLPVAKWVAMLWKHYRKTHDRTSGSGSKYSYAYFLFPQCDLGHCACSEEFHPSHSSTQCTVWSMGYSYKHTLGMVPSLSVTTSGWGQSIRIQEFTATCDYGTARINHVKQVEIVDILFIISWNEDVHVSTGNSGWSSIPHSNCQLHRLPDFIYSHRVLHMQLASAQDHMYIHTYLCSSHSSVRIGVNCKSTVERKPSEFIREPLADQPKLVLLGC